MKHILKERLGFSFEGSRLPRKLLGVYTGRGPISEEDFTERLRIYASLVEEDKHRARAARGLPWPPEGALQTPMDERPLLPLQRPRPEASGG